MEQKDIIIVIMFILIIYCIYQINNLKENFDLTSGNNAGFIQIGNWFIQDRGDCLSFMRGARTDANTKMVLWANNNPGASYQVGLYVPELQINNGRGTTWRINTNEDGSLIFSNNNPTHKWIDFNANLHMYTNNLIQFGDNWKLKVGTTNNFDIAYSDENKISLASGNGAHWKSGGNWI